jgi:hypothetical protein
MLWTKPETTGKSPGPTRAHSSVIMGKKMFTFGGGDGKVALNSMGVLDLGKIWNI